MSSNEKRDYAEKHLHEHLADEAKERAGTLTDEDLDKLRILQRGLAIFIAALTEVAQRPEKLDTGSVSMREGVVARGRLLSRAIADACEMLEGKESKDAQ